MKAKAIFSGILAAMVTLASCSSNEPVDPEQNRLVKGDPSYTAFSIKMSKPSTRAVADDDYSDPTEQSVQSVNIYIFSGGVLEVTSKPEINSEVTAPVAVSTGDKVVYAVTSENIELTAVAEETLLKDFEKQLFDAASEKIAADGDFVMIGREKITVIKCTEEQARNNPQEIAVDRAAAKLQVKYDAEKVKVRETINAQFSACEFTPAQSIRQMYLTLGEGMYSFIGEKTTDSKNKAKSYYPGLVDVPATFEDGVFCTSPTEFSVDYAESRYMGENINENPTTGKVTFALVRLKAKPNGKLYGNKNLPTDGTFYVLARNIASSSTWIFASDNNYNIVYFATEADAKKYGTDNNLSSDFKPYKYDKGMTYYRVDLKNTADEEATLSQKYRVVRNNYYRVNITEIKNLGAPTAPGVVPDDPETPIEQDSFLACELTVKPWTFHEQNSTLQ